MNKQELEKYKKALLDLRKQIADEVDHIADETLKKSQREASGDLSGYSFHLADMATDNYDREFSLGLASSGREALLLIDDALKRIEEKGFGKCLKCKKAIGTKRLKALPYAEHCIDCQEKEEGQKRK